MSAWTNSRRMQEVLTHGNTTHKTFLPQFFLIFLKCQVSHITSLYFFYKTTFFLYIFRNDCQFWTTITPSMLVWLLVIVDFLVTKSSKSLSSYYLTATVFFPFTKNHITISLYHIIINSRNFLFFVLKIIKLETLKHLLSDIVLRTKFEFCKCF